ncbi:MAG: endo-1,4-beta-xylanase [Chloroflexi bacterium]|nr:endo-1,4-beta-xylanase [Chloroflexota bacterium]
MVGEASSPLKLSLAVVLLLFLGLTSYVPPPAVLARLPLETRHPIVSVHTRLTEEVEARKIVRTLALAGGMGAAWAVEYFPWAYIEPEKGRYDWRHADLVVDAAYRQGLNLVARVDYVPAWARPKDSTSRYVDRQVVKDYGHFLFTFVNRYKDRVKHYIVWNEPNVAAEWGYGKISGGAYTELLKTAYERAKQADPEARIVSAGLAPTLEKSDLGLDELDYLQQMYDAGAKDYFDILGAHAYGYKSPPDDPPAPDKINFARVELLRQVMERNGDGAKRVMITEAGWNDHPRWTRAVRPGQRVEYTVRAYQKAEQDWPWVMAVAMWEFKLPRPANNYNDYYTFLTPDFRPKAVYEAVKKWAKGE